MNTMLMYNKKKYTCICENYMGKGKTKTEKEKHRGKKVNREKNEKRKTLFGSRQQLLRVANRVRWLGSMGYDWIFYRLVSRNDGPCMLFRFIRLLYLLPKMYWASYKRPPSFSSWNEPTLHMCISAWLKKTWFKKCILATRRCLGVIWIPSF